MSIDYYKKYLKYKIKYIELKEHKLYPYNKIGGAYAGAAARRATREASKRATREASKRATEYAKAHEYKSVIEIQEEIKSLEKTDVVLQNITESFYDDTTFVFQIDKDNFLILFEKQIRKIYGIKLHNENVTPDVVVVSKYLSNKYNKIMTKHIKILANAIHEETNKSKHKMIKGKEGAKCWEKLKINVLIKKGSRMYDMKSRLGIKYDYTKMQETFVFENKHKESVGSYLKFFMPEYTFVFLVHNKYKYNTEQKFNNLFRKLIEAGIVNKECDIDFYYLDELNSIYNELVKELVAMEKSTPGTILDITGDVWEILWTKKVLENSKSQRETDIASLKRIEKIKRQITATEAGAATEPEPMVLEPMLLEPARATKEDAALERAKIAKEDAEKKAEAEAHAHAQTQAHAQAHAQAQTHALTQAHSQIEALKQQLQTQTDALTQAQTEAQAHTDALTQAQTEAQAHSQIEALKLQVQALTKALTQARAQYRALQLQLQTQTDALTQAQTEAHTDALTQARAQYRALQLQTHADISKPEIRTLSTAIESNLQMLHDPED